MFRKFLRGMDICKLAQKLITETFGNVAIYGDDTCGTKVFAGFSPPCLGTKVPGNLVGVLSPP